MTEPKDPQLDQLNQAVVQLYRQGRFEEALPRPVSCPCSCGARRSGLRRSQPSGTP